MLISCLTVTQPGRQHTLRRAIECFNQQSYRQRELVIVHDGDQAHADAIDQIISEYPGNQIRVVQAEKDLTLGALRNLTVASARGELVCQWDDDDLYHPDRLAVQIQHLQTTQGDFCFLTDQLHWFETRDEFYWDDWNVETWPMNLIQGTLLGRRDLLPQYPALDRGEDTPLLQQLWRQGAKLVGLGGQGYLYIYSYTGDNAWDYQHHAAISAWKRLRKPELEAARQQLAMELARYELPIKQARFPHDEGALLIDLN